MSHYTLFPLHSPFMDLESRSGRRRAAPRLEDGDNNNSDNDDRTETTANSNDYTNDDNSNCSSSSNNNNTNNNNSRNRNDTNTKNNRAPARRGPATWRATAARRALVTDKYIVSIVLCYVLCYSCFVIILTI